MGKGMLKYCVDYNFDFKDKVTLNLIFRTKLTNRQYYTRDFISFLISKVEKIKLIGEYNYEDLIFVKQFNKEVVYK